MPTIIWSKSKGKDKLDPSMKKKAYAFFEKLQEDDALPGLNIEEIRGSRDKRVRTGRVDDNFRAVLFKLKQTDDAVYVVHGIWPHDDANLIAEKVTLVVNPVNGMPEVRAVLDDAILAATQQAAAPVVVEPAGVDGRSSRGGSWEEAAAEGTTAVAGTQPWSFDLDAASLRDLGLDATLAEAAVRAQSDAEFQAVIEGAPVEWQTLALLSLATGSTVDDVRREFHLDGRVAETGSDDERLVRALQSDAAKTSFHWIEDDDELRTIVEAGDFGAWRVFLHPEQRNYVERDWKGAFRLSGGAGTGKTVVAVHRTRRLALAEPSSRILLTT